MLINIEISSFCWYEENYAELLQVLHNKEMDFFLKHLCPREKTPHYNRVPYTITAATVQYVGWAWFLAVPWLLLRWAKRCIVVAGFCNMWADGRGEVRLRGSCTVYVHIRW